MKPETSEAAAAELVTYHRNAFDTTVLDRGLPLPLPDEPFVDFWRPLVAEAQDHGAWTTLSQRLPQLAFPIREGISQTEPYRAATRRGMPTVQIPEATGLALQRPEALELQLYATPAGHLPLLIVRHRPDFVTLLRALARRNEPVPVPDGQGALMVAGYNNWCRISALKRQWEQSNDLDRAATWNDELARLQDHKELFQDRFILLSDGPYSATAAVDLGLPEDEWRQRSLLLRRDHEAAHYFTLRAFGAMRNHLHDELMADFAGLMGAFGHYRADWFLRFLGVGEYARPGRRLDLYRGDPALGDAAFEHLQIQIAAAAHNLERFDRNRPRDEQDPFATARVLAALATVSLDELSKDDGEERLTAAVNRWAAHSGSQPAVSQANT